VLVIDDVRKAFDNVVIALLLEHHVMDISDPRLFHLPAVVFRDHEPRKAVGIDQGRLRNCTIQNSSGLAHRAGRAHGMAGRIAIHLLDLQATRPQLLRR
jgi:hypothetical protein